MDLNIGYLAILSLQHIENKTYFKTILPGTNRDCAKNVKLPVVSGDKWLLGGIGPYMGEACGDRSNWT